MTRAAYRVCMVVLSAALAIAGAAWMRGRLGPTGGVLAAAASDASDDDRAAYYRALAAQTPGLADAVPEADVGRLLQPGLRKVELGAEIVTNNAGLRSSFDYGPKDADAFRILCIGDSFVYGTGGAEADRWTSQVALELERLDVRPDGKRIEVYNAGVGSWTAFNEVSYLTSRLTAYAPDLVIALLTPNDISDTSGVSGTGQPTSAFSPGARARGSGTFVYDTGAFGAERRSLLPWGLSPESESRWRATFEAWKRLEELLLASGARLLVSVLSERALFVELCRAWHTASGMTSPFLCVDYRGERLPHDGHPSRAGHAILAGQYLHALAELGWLPLERAALAPLPDGLELDTRATPDLDEIQRMQRRYASSLPEAIDGAALDADATAAFFGGVFPRDRDAPFAAPPDVSVHAGFLLRRKAGAERVEVTIEAPRRPELYPLEIRMHVDGAPGAELRLASVEEAGRHVLAAALQERDALVVEIVLDASRHYCEIDDPTMRSFALIDARQTP